MRTFIEIVAECLEVEDVTLQEDFQFKMHPKWDSLAALGLIVAIEDEYGVVLNDGDLQNLHTLQDLAKFVHQVGS